MTPHQLAAAVAATKAAEERYAQTPEGKAEARAELAARRVAQEKERLEELAARRARLAAEPPGKAPPQEEADPEQSPDDAKKLAAVFAALGVKQNDTEAAREEFERLIGPTEKAMRKLTIAQRAKVIATRVSPVKFLAALKKMR